MKPAEFIYNVLPSTSGQLGSGFHGLQPPLVIRGKQYDGETCTGGMKFELLDDRSPAVWLLMQDDRCPASQLLDRAGDFVFRTGIPSMDEEDGLPFAWGGVDSATDSASVELVEQVEAVPNRAEPFKTGRSPGVVATNTSSM